VVYVDPNGVGINIADLPGSRALSAVSLTLNILGNALIFLRFTTTARRWRFYMSASVLCMNMKVVLSVANLTYYGTRGYRGDEGASFVYSQVRWLHSPFLD
jgi:hypothetical protein